MYLLKLDFLIFYLFFLVYNNTAQTDTGTPPPIIPIVMMMMITAGYVKIVSSYYIRSCGLLKKLEL